jgi:hypothetical protein
MEGQGDKAREVRRIKFKRRDKRAALVDLGRPLGMFRDISEDSWKLDASAAFVEMLKAISPSTIQSSSTPIERERRRL